MISPSARLWPAHLQTQSLMQLMMPSKVRRTWKTGSQAVKMFESYCILTFIFQCGIRSHIVPFTPSNDDIQYITFYHSNTVDRRITLFYNQRRQPFLISTDDIFMFAIPFDRSIPFVTTNDDNLWFYLHLLLSEFYRCHLHTIYTNDDNHRIYLLFPAQTVNRNTHFFLSIDDIRLYIIFSAQYR